MAGGSSRALGGLLGAFELGPVVPDSSMGTPESSEEVGDGAGDFIVGRTL